MRLIVIAFAAILAANAAEAQSTPVRFDLPVSIETIRAGLERPTFLKLESLDERPTFRMQILERQRIDELLSTLDFKTTRAPGGIYWNEMQRVTWPASDHPLIQPYAPFSGGEIITLAIEDAIGKLGAKKLMSAVSNASKNRAQAAAREEVLQAIQDYCAAQPANGTGIQICTTSAAVR